MESIAERQESSEDNLEFYLLTSLVAQMVKNPPAMRETWVRSLSSEDLLEEGMATHSSILGRRIPMNRRACRATVHVVIKRHNLATE